MCSEHKHSNGLWQCKRRAKYTLYSMQHPNCTVCTACMCLQCLHCHKPLECLCHVHYIFYLLPSISKCIPVMKDKILLNLLFVGCLLWSLRREYCSHLAFGGCYIQSVPLHCHLYRIDYVILWCQTPKLSFFTASGSFKQLRSMTKVLLDSMLTGRCLQIFFWDPAKFK